MWESKAYTNAIIGDVFLEMAKIFPEMKVKNYLDLKIDTQGLKPYYGGDFIPY